MNRIQFIFAQAIESRMDEVCPAIQDAIDRIVTAEGFRKRCGMLEVLRSGNYLRSDFCSALLSAWKDADIQLATGHSRDWWLELLDASPECV